jgi:hypothetical protein
LRQLWGRLALILTIAVAVTACSHPDRSVDPTTSLGHARECAAAASQAVQSLWRGPFQHAVLKGVPRSRRILGLTEAASRVDEWAGNHLSYKVAHALFPNVGDYLHWPTPADRRDYFSILAQRARYLSEYEKDLDCTREFRAAGISVDPGAPTRERLLLSGALRDADVRSYSREIIEPNGAAWVATINESCSVNPSQSPGAHDAAHRFVTDTSPCGGTEVQSIARRLKDKWTDSPLGGHSCEAVLRRAYHEDCPSP